MIPRPSPSPSPVGQAVSVEMRSGSVGRARWGVSAQARPEKVVPKSTPTIMFFVMAEGIFYELNDHLKLVYLGRGKKGTGMNQVEAASVSQSRSHRSSKGASQRTRQGPDRCMQEVQEVIDEMGDASRHAGAQSGRTWGKGIYIS